LDKELTRVVGIYIKENQHRFSEIFNVLARQVGASIEIDKDEESVDIEFEYRVIKGASSSLV
jgi:hypothetical protein